MKDHRIHPEGERTEENIEVARAAVRIAITSTREEETDVKRRLLEHGIRAAAVDFGGEFIATIPRVVERAVVAAKRERVIRAIHPHEGAVAGASRETLGAIGARATGFNVGGKVGIAARGEHLVVAVFVGVGLLHLDDCAMAISHRAIHA